MRPFAADVARSVICLCSVCLCVCAGHTGKLRRNGQTDRNVVWMGTHAQTQPALHWLGLQIPPQEVTLLRVRDRCRDYAAAMRPFIKILGQLVIFYYYITRPQGEALLSTVHSCLFLMCANDIYFYFFYVLRLGLAL